MKSAIIIIVLMLTASICLADFISPLADFPIGTNASGKVTITVTTTSAGNTNYMATLFTDSGPRTYPVAFPSDVSQSIYIGKECVIEAMIEKDDTTKWKRRFRITKIELKSQKKTN